MSNERLFETAKKFIPGGVNSPVRAFGSVRGTPRFVVRGSRAVMTDADGRTYIDYLGGWGPLVLGHADPVVRAALVEQLESGWSFGTPTEIEVRLAEAVCRCVPSIERVRMVSSGTEAAMSAIRLARGYTGRDGVIKFRGCYHGHSDSMLVEAGSGAATLGVPSSPGVTKGTTKDTITCPYNDADAVRSICREMGKQIACIIVEPVAGNMGVVPPRAGFLQSLRETCDEIGALLVFDEVITGFRLSLGGAQAIYGVAPDITLLGKIIGGGLPVGAYGGREEIMRHISPEGPVYQAGTLSGNPLAMTAGYAVIQQLSRRGVYEELESKGAFVERAARKISARWPGKISFNRIGSMFTFFFAEGPIVDFESASRSDAALYGKFFHEMLGRGFYLPPSPFESCFVSLAHTTSDLEQTADAVDDAIETVLRGVSA